MKVKTYIWIAGIVTLAVATGCSNTSIKEAKVLAHQRWQTTRADVLCSVGEEHLKVGQLDKANQKLLEAIALDEESPRGHLLLGRVHIEQGNYNEAIVQLNEVLRREPNHAGAYYYLGVAEEKSRQFEAALKSYRRSYELDSSDLSAIKAAAEVLLAMDRPREAELYIESYLPLADSDAGFHELGGRLASIQKDYDKAVRFYQEACDLDGQNNRYQELLARALFSAGRLDEAAASLETLATRRKETTPLWVYMMLGECYLALNRPEQARRTFWTVSEQNSSSPDCWVGLARASLLAGDSQRAIVSARQALDLAPNRPDALLVLGYALLKADNPQEAVRRLVKGLEADPDNGIMRCLLGRAYAASGDAPRASECYREALRRDPDNTLARRLLNGQAGKEISRAE